MSSRCRFPIREEDGKLALADALYAKYNYILQCPGCGTSSLSGAFNKSTAGTAGLTNNRYRRYVCRQKLVQGTKRCSKTVSTTTLIQLCTDHPNIGILEVRAIQQTLG